MIVSTGGVVWWFITFMFVAECVMLLDSWSMQDNLISLG